jgi:D-alanine--poly(phosphoribitol) ligase subunit 2
MRDAIKTLLQSLHPEVDYENTTDLVSQSILDSFDIVSLIGEIDEVIGVHIPPQCILPEHFESLEALFCLIHELKK